jgi:hypothetical protein
MVHQKKKYPSIKEEFNAGINHRIVDIKGVLDSASKQNLIRVEDKAELEGLTRIILALYHGLALQLIHNPDIKTDEKMWNVLKKCS